VRYWVKRACSWTSALESQVKLLRRCWQRSGSAFPNRLGGREGAGAVCCWMAAIWAVVVLICCSMSVTWAARPSRLAEYRWDCRSRIREANVAAMALAISAARVGFGFWTVIVSNCVLVTTSNRNGLLQLLRCRSQLELVDDTLKDRLIQQHLRIGTGHRLGSNQGCRIDASVDRGWALTSSRVDAS